MRYSELTNLFPNSPLFSTQQLLLLDDSLSTQNLSDWIEAGYITQLKRWRYVIVDRLQSEQDLLHISSRIVRPSYVSMETALSIYNLIPEAVMQTTAITTKKTQTIDSVLWAFSYRSIDPDHFWWYELISESTWSYYLACVEKALLDYLYYHHEMDNDASFQERRILRPEFHALVDREVLDMYLAKFDSKALNKRTRLFLTYIDHA